MTDYKNIRGKKIKFLTSDLSGEQQATIKNENDRV